MLATAPIASAEAPEGASVGPCQWPPSRRGHAHPRAKFVVDALKRGDARPDRLGRRSNVACRYDVNNGHDRSSCTIRLPVPGRATPGRSFSRKRTSQLLAISGPDFARACLSRSQLPEAARSFSERTRSSRAVRRYAARFRPRAARRELTGPGASRGWLLPMRSARHRASESGITGPHHPYLSIKRSPRDCGHTLRVGEIEEIEQKVIRLGLEQVVVLRPRNVSRTLERL